MKIISFILKYSRRKVMLAAGVGCIAGLSTAALMALINIHLKSAGGLTRGLVWAFVGLVITLFVSNLVSRFTLIDLSQRMIFDLRMRLCEQSLNVSLSQLDRIGANRVMATLTQDISAIEAALLVFPVFCVNLAMTLSCLAYLCWLSPSLMAALGIVMIITILSLEWIQKRANHWLKSAREDWDALVSHFRALTDGRKEFKIHRRRRRAFLSGILRTSAEAHRRHNARGRQLVGLNSTGAQMFYFIFIGLLLFVFPSLWKVGPEALIAYTLIVLFVRTPIAFMVDVMPVFGIGNLALQKVETLGLSFSLTDPRDSEDSPEPECFKWDCLELVGVTHRYENERGDDQFVLGPIDMSFRPGELVFLVGGNGSGKTTLAMLITNLYIPETGEIRWDGKPVTDENRDDLRQLFSAVFSPPFLLEHLLGVDPRNQGRQAQDYLAKLQLDHKVQIRDGAFSTTDLSQGQRKRLALLTAYLEDRPIYVFDEWAADQDPLFKAVFYTQLLPELKARGKLVLVITHDDKYYHLADRIIMLEYGQVIHDGDAARAGYSESRMPAGISYS